MAVGATAVIQGGLDLADRDRQTTGILLLGVLLLVTGISLLIGLLTPIAGVLVAAAAIGIAFSWLPASTPNLFNAPLPATLVVVVAVAVVFLGPGSSSLDCRLFGRREIIIPLSTRSPRS
jgi:uncharacterized membrane protein YphA (DoxX/SURF4 family)